MDPPSGIIFDIKKFSIHDGPGIRTTIFLKGCPLHCSWCHNPEGISPLKEIQFWVKRCIGCHECIEACELQALSFVDGMPVRDLKLCQGCGACAEVCPTEATELIGRTMTLSEVMVEIEKDVIYYDQSGGGVTFSGGEPLFQIEFLASLLEICKDRGIHTAVDTSGFVQFGALETILPLVDLFLYDIKMINEKRHIQYTGVPNHTILNNLNALSKLGADIVIRIPIIPGINDTIKGIQEIGEFLSSLERIHPVNILPYHRAAIDKYNRMNGTYLLRDIQPPSTEHMESIAEQIERFGLTVSIGG
jgi:pyruvate formate lyase activating enzyme